MSLSIPSPGFGTYKITDEAECAEAVLSALQAGYRHIDTAAVYGNEAAVGEGLRRSGLPREDVFVTSKVWNTERGYDSTLKACEKSLEALGLEYLDLYLIHWPANRMQFGDKADTVNRETWRAMERLVDQKLVRFAGLSNFYASHMEPVLSGANICPAADQIEFHPGLLQEETVSLCRKYGMTVEAWSPLGRGRLLDNQELVAVASSHGKTPAQVLLRWCVQMDVVPLVKSVHHERIAENLDIFDFSLTGDEMSSITALPDIRFGSHPDTAAF